MAAVLLWAALEKARNPAPMATTIHSLGLPRRIAWPAALLVAAAEIALAIAGLFRPDPALIHLGIILMAGLFALAGLIALRRNELIRCSCFGIGGKGFLGVTQLIAFFPWLAGAAILRLGFQEPPPLP